MPAILLARGDLTSREQQVVPGVPAHHQAGLAVAETNTTGIRRAPLYWLDIV